jgi:hypothetical protein
VWLSRGNGTLPVLDLDGMRIVDSTRIIGALENRRPEPPLYPADPDERRRALELEDFFDEHAGHDMRRVGFWEARRNLPHALDFMTTDQPRIASAVARAGLRATFPFVWRYMSARYPTSFPSPRGGSSSSRHAITRRSAGSGRRGAATARHRRPVWTFIRGTEPVLSSDIEWG